MEPGVSTVRILPTRTHRLAGQRVQVGVPATVPADAADLAIRHGWAVLAAEDKAKPKSKAKTVPGVDDPHPEVAPDTDA